MIEHLQSSANEVSVSLASLWEMTVKVAIGKLDSLYIADGNPTLYLERTGFQLLPITLDHAMATRLLPLHHRDPFDRMLIAQAIEEDLTLVTSDKIFERYDALKLLKV